MANEFCLARNGSSLHLGAKAKLGRLEKNSLKARWGESQALRRGREGGQLGCVVCREKCVKCIYNSYGCRVGGTCVPLTF